MSDQDWRLRRKDNRAEITLPQDMRWTDEFDWAKTAQAEPQRTLSGGLVIQQGIKQNGRPVTLAGDWVWLPRATLETLREWADTPELEMVLEHTTGACSTLYSVCTRAYLPTLSPCVLPPPKRARNATRQPSV